MGLSLDFIGRREDGCPYCSSMETTRNTTGSIAGEPPMVLLWRHPHGEAACLASLKASAEPPVLVRLVNEPVDDDAFEAARREHGLRVVALPMAFAGLNEHDQVLRDAVMQRLQQQETAAASAAG